MATIEELSAGLVKADAAGNTADAKAFADAIRSMQAPSVPGNVTVRSTSTGEVGSTAPSVSAPSTASATPVFDAFRAGFDQNYQKANPAPVDVSSNPQRSVLPGILGQVANTANAATAGMSQGMTAGWGDELAAATQTPIDMIRNRSWNVPLQYGKALSDLQAVNTQSEALNPQAAHAGDVTGSLAMIGKAPVQAGANIIAAATRPAANGLWWKGALSSGAYGTANGAGRGVTPAERIQGAWNSGLSGLATGALAGKLAQEGLSPPKASAPSLSDLEAVKNAAYQHADQLGVTYSPSGYDDLVNNLVADAKANHINPDLHKGSAAVLQDMASKPHGFAPTLTELDQLRQIARRDAASSPADAEFGRNIVNGIDDFIDNAKNAQVATFRALNDPAERSLYGILPSDSSPYKVDIATGKMSQGAPPPLAKGNVISGSGSAGAAAIADARAANSAWRKSQAVQALIENAKLQAGGANSGGNLNNALRQQFKGLVRVDPKTGMSLAQKQGFSAEEIRQMRNLTMGGTWDNALRFYGNLLKPNAITAGPWAFAIHAAPPIAVIPASGQMAKYLADTGTVGKANSIANMVASRNMPSTTAPAIPDAIQQLLSRSPFVIGTQAAQLPQALPLGPIPQGLPDGAY